MITEDYGRAEEEAFRQSRETDQDRVVIADDDEGTYQVVTADEAARFMQDTDRYRMVYAALPYDGGIAEIHGGRTEFGEK